MSKELRKAKEWKDARGNIFQPGSRVAFNYSGDVATGVLEHITPGGEFHIRRDPEYVGANPISKVKRFRSLVVIFESQKIRDQIVDLRVEMKEYYQSLLDSALQKLEKREDKLKEDYLALIKAVREAGDVDDVTFWLTERFGEDVLEEDDDVPEWLTAP